MKIDNINDIMKQAQLMQEKMQQAQNEVANLTVTGESGAGLVKITMTGRYDVKKVHLDSTLLKEEKEILEDLIAAAMNDAVRRTEQTTQEKMSTLTGGFKMPPGFKMPF